MIREIDAEWRNRYVPRSSHIEVCAFIASVRYAWGTNPDVRFAARVFSNNQVITQFVLALASQPNPLNFIYWKVRKVYIISVLRPQPDLQTERMRSAVKCSAVSHRGLPLISWLKAMAGMSCNVASRAAATVPE